ncbi:MAG: CPBP family intramembrane metalloprotease [Cryomorphaceae bacterium]|nr:MAG: CPBP family intramembrane metalloprotease [Cryomorphaceae bacterium]
MSSRRYTLKKGLLIFLVGFVGVCSLLFSSFPLPTELFPDDFSLSETELKLLILINPTLLLAFSVILGSLLQRPTRLTTPYFDYLVKLEQRTLSSQPLVHGVAGGIIAGLSISFVTWLFVPYLPQTYLALSESVQPAVITRLLYGGITEEILVRFGLMTLFVWIGLKIAPRAITGVHITAVLLAALLFAIGHFPALLMMVDAPTPALIAYILCGNLTGGVVFGYLYWKQGLESAMVAHIVTHLVMIGFG